MEEYTEMHRLADMYVTAARLLRDRKNYGLDWGAAEMVIHDLTEKASEIRGNIIDAPQTWGAGVIVEDVDGAPHEPLPKPESLTANDFRWAEDTTEWAEKFTREELLWIVQTAEDAIKAQDEADEARKAEAAVEAKWDARRAELIEQFNGGPLNVASGQPIPTMALKAVEYIIEQERKQEESK